MPPVCPPRVGRGLRASRRLRSLYNPANIIFAFLGALLSSCQSVPPLRAPTVSAAQLPSEKLPPPAPFVSTGLGGKLSPFERQFRHDTGENDATRRAEVHRFVQTDDQPKQRFFFNFDLSAWPEALRSRVRVWVAVGAESQLSTVGPFSVGFLQNNVGLVTSLDYTFNVEGTMVLGSDFSAADGPIALEIDRLSLPPGVAYQIHATVYLPQIRESPQPGRAGIPLPAASE